MGVLPGFAIVLGNSKDIDKEIANNVIKALETDVRH